MSLGVVEQDGAEGVGTGFDGFLREVVGQNAKPLLTDFCRFCPDVGRCARNGLVELLHRHRFPRTISGELHGERKNTVVKKTGSSIL